MSSSWVFLVAVGVLICSASECLQAGVVVRFRNETEVVVDSLKFQDDGVRLVFNGKSYLISSSDIKQVKPVTSNDDEPRKNPAMNKESDNSSTVQKSIDVVPEKPTAQWRTVIYVDGKGDGKSRVFKLSSDLLKVRWKIDCFDPYRGWTSKQLSASLYDTSGKYISNILSTSEEKPLRKVLEGKRDVARSFSGAYYLEVSTRDHCSWRLIISETF